MSLSEIDSSISTNLLSHFYTLKAFLPGMMASELGGTIVTVSSVIGHVGAARLTDYAAAKAGITALHKSLVAELAASPAADRMRAILVTAGQLSTPLFHGVRTPNALIAPVVEPVDVAHEIISMVDAGKSGHITLPLYAGWIDWYNVLPAGLQRIARALAGVDTAMNDFVGRAGLAAQAKAAEKSGEK